MKSTPLSLRGPNHKSITYKTFFHSRDRVIDKTLHLVRVFVSNLNPGNDFTEIGLSRKLQTMEGFDPARMKPSLERLQQEGAVERVDDVKGKRWKAAARVANPSDSKHDIRGLAGGVVRPNHGRLAERFVIPPFSVLDARSGTWKSRKAQWLRLGIESEVGRGGQLLGGLGESSVWHANGTSIFDPVLVEALVRWFSPEGGKVLDPFAGGSVRGIVTGELGRHYQGIDLRQEQVDANVAQAEKLKPFIKPTWLCGDSEAVLQTDKVERADMVLTCPPYGDLEKYSDDEADLSNMSHDDMLAKYQRIIAHATEKLKLHRFFCIVVGDFRDPKGYFRDFVSDTIACCLESGMKLYNQAILLTALTSIPMRASKQFVGPRKLGMCHQYVLVFVKGHAKKAAEVCRSGLAALPEATEVK